MKTVPENVHRDYNSVLIILFISIFFSVFLSWTIYSQLNNTLKNNDNWISSKQNLQMYVWGRDEYVNMRPALNSNKLNLASWFGFQEILTKNKYPVDTVKFDFYLDNDAYLYFIFNKDNEKFSALRLSVNNLLPTEYIEAYDSGEFQLKKSIELTNLSPNKWHHANVIFNNDTNKILISIDNDSYAEISSDIQTEQVLGFRGSFKNAYIDNFIVVNSDGHKLFSDNFSYKTNGIPHVFIYFISIFLLINVVSYFILIYIKRVPKDSLMSLTLINITLLIILVTIEIFLKVVFLDSYPNSKSKLSLILNKTTSSELRENIRQIEENQSLELAKKSYFGSKTILFLGSSQTWGAGAKIEQDTLVNNISKLINNAQSNENNTQKILGINSENESFNVVNGAISGSNSTNMLNNYKKVWLSHKPSILVLNLSNNDYVNIVNNESDIDTFENNLREFAKINQQNNIKTIFILEANSPEINPRELFLHHVMKAVAIDNNIQVIDLHKYLISKLDTGIIWWDMAHLTTYGQELSSKYIFASIKDAQPIDFP